jgi:hypothetical protein
VSDSYLDEGASLIMRISKRALPSVLAAALTVLALAVGAAAKSDHGKRHGRHHSSPVLKASLAPSLPADPAFHGVAAGGAPWVLKRGAVEIKKSDRIDLSVKGLVIPNPPGDGTPGPVNTISASLYCGADSDATAADTTASTPIDTRGNARIKDRSFATPDTCLAPVILVHPNGDNAHYIAVEGWRP